MNIMKKYIWLSIFCLCAGLCRAGDLWQRWGSLEALEQAAQAHKPAAQAELGLYYFRAGAYERALPWLEKAAQKKNAEGLFGLGLCYERGVCGPEANLKKAVKYYQKAAAKNQPAALYQLAVMYQNGEGVRANPRKALAYLHRAAAQNDEDALQFLAEAHYKGDYDGIAQDYQQAKKYWEKLSAQGNLRARFNLAHLYYNGYGVEKNLRRAFELDRSTAMDGMPEAQYQVGQAYLNGDGVEVDGVAGMQWIEKAAAQGYGPAVEHMKTAAYYEYTGPDVGYASKGRVISPAELKKEAQAGDPAAQYLYAQLCGQVLYKTGEECNPLEWLEKAAAQGLKAAQDMLEDFYKQQAASAP